MIPRKLALRNFMCYREDVPPLEFDGLGIACLSGENGAGKSALLDALTWALWGESRLKSDDDLIALGATEMEVELTFALDGQDYRIIRKRSKAKRTGQSWLDFQVRSGDAWKSLTAASLRETQQTITSTLRMGYETFANSAFLRQGRADEFTRKEPSKRKQVLAEILGLDVYEQLEGGSKERAKSLDGQMKVVEGQIAELERLASEQEFRAKEVESAERHVASVAEQLAEADMQLSAATARVQALEQLRQRSQDLRKRQDDIRRERDDLAVAVERLRRAVNESEQVVARRAEIMAGVAQLEAAQAEQRRYDDLRDPYDQLLERYRAHEKAVDTAEGQIKADLRLAEGELKRLRDAAARRPQLEAQVAELQRQSSGFPSLQDELGKARARRAELSEKLQEASRLQVERGKLAHQIDLKKASLTKARDDLKRQQKEAEEQIRRLEQARPELERALRRQEALQADLDALEQLRADERGGVDRAGALRAECAHIKAQGDEINRKLALLKEQGDAHECPLCGSELGHSGVERIEQQYDRERADLRALFSTKNNEAKQIEASLAQLGEQIARREGAASEMQRLAGQIARGEADLAAAEQARARMAADQRALEDVQLQLLKGDYEHGTRAELAKVDAMISALGDVETVKRQLAQAEEQSQRAERRIEEQRGIITKIESIQRDIQAIEDSLPALHDQETLVGELQTTLGMDDFAQEDRLAMERIKQQAKDLGYSSDAHRAAGEQARALVRWEEERRRLERAEERLADDRAALARDEQSLARRDEDLADADARLAEIQTSLLDLGPATRERDAAQLRADDLRRVLGVAQRDLGEKRGKLATVENAAVELFSQQQRRKELATRKALYDELTLSFGKKGVQALLIETAVPEIQEEANKLLGRMTDNQMHLTFETQGATKKGDVTETLEIKIADGLGTRVYDAYSGGESFRVDFAIRIALAKLLARRAGARLETLVIDEGFGSQDAKGRERLVEAITSVQQDFGQILVVTHIQELKDLFPVQIEITKKPEGSTWAIA